MELVIDIYQTTETFPPFKARSLVDQIRRASVSIASNIAEGAGRQTVKEFIRFLHMAQGSVSELDTQLELTLRLNYLKKKDWGRLDKQMVKIDKMVTGLIRQQRGISKEQKVRSEE